MHGLKEVVCCCFLRGKGEGGSEKPFRGLGACSTEIRTSEITASKLFMVHNILV